MDNPEVFIYEMGYTLEEFGRVLNGGFTNDHSPYSCQPQPPDGWRVTHDQHPVRIDIRLNKLPDRQLGAFSLPVLEVRFEVKQASDSQRNDFFDKFFKYFHKGGG